MSLALESAAIESAAVAGLGGRATSFSFVRS
jgi:hypothetical protein